MTSTERRTGVVRARFAVGDRLSEGEVVKGEVDRERSSTKASTRTRGTVLDTAESSSERRAKSREGEDGASFSFDAGDASAPSVAENAPDSSLAARAAYAAAAAAAPLSSAATTVSSSSSSSTFVFAPSTKS